MTEASLLKKPQILRAAASGGRCVFDREKQPAGHIEFSLSRRGQLARQAHGVLDRGGDMDVGGRIGAPRRSGDSPAASAPL